MKSHSLSKIVCLIIISLVHVISFSETVNIYIPQDVNTSDWIENRQRQQLATKKDLSVYHDFSFTDTQSNSGINFLHRIVDDAGKHYKAVHYDHGNGVAVADINGDDILDIYFVSQVGPNGLYLNLGDGKFKDITQQSGTRCR